MLNFYGTNFDASDAHFDKLCPFSDAYRPEKLETRNNVRLQSSGEKKNPVEYHDL
jgi:hypothetical protein